MVDTEEEAAAAAEGKETQQHPLSSVEDPEETHPPAATVESKERPAEPHQPRTNTIVLPGDSTLNLFKMRRFFVLRVKQFSH